MPSEPFESLIGVSETALGAAEMRAEEGLRSDRLFDDPYAAAFVAAAPPLFADVPAIADGDALAEVVAAAIAGIAVRTRFFDDYLSAACAAGCGQVVLLAAGLDTRAFRLDWPRGVQLFELDLPELFTFKERVLAEQGAVPKCSRRMIAVDLREDWSARLTEAGFEPSLPCVWAAEGLLAYLSNDDAEHLLTTVGDLSASGSQLSFEYDDFADGSSLSQVRATPGMEEVASMWQGGLSGDPQDWLRRHDWRVRTHDLASLAGKYGRARPGPATGGYLIAERDH